MPPGRRNLVWLPQLRSGLDTEGRSTARPGRLSLVRAAARLDTRPAPGRGCALYGASPGRPGSMRGIWQRRLARLRNRVRSPRERRLL